jgi:uncharacterized membrane protein
MERQVDRYLRELEAHLADLPRSRRRELVAEIEEHIEDALAATPEPDEAQVRNVLERLGEPEEIAREARERFGVPRPTSGWREILALVLLPIGGVIVPVVGWVVGAVLLWTSPVWSTRDKVVGTLVWPGGLLVPVYLSLFATGASPCMTAVVDGRVVSNTCGSPSGLQQALAIVVAVGIFIAPIVCMIYLAQRMRRRTAAA